MKKVLIINENSLIRDFLKAKLESFNLEVQLAANGFEGQLKIRSEEPDLVVMDFYLSRVNSREVLRSKLDNPNTKSIPVIMLVGKASKEELLKLAPFKIQKFFAKPIKMDTLIETVSDMLSLDIKIDTTPCIVDAHFNEGIIFVELARGLNTEKIDLLKLKIGEIIKLYGVSMPKVLIIMTDIQVTDEDAGKFHHFLSSIRDTTGTPMKGIKILTPSDAVKGLLSSLADYNTIEVTENIKDAMDKLLGVEVSKFVEDGLNLVKEDFLKAERAQNEVEETIQLRFNDEKIKAGAKAAPSDAKQEESMKIAIVDDDPVIRELIKTAFSDTPYSVLAYENGKVFIEKLEINPPDLIFLDLLMPEMDGFSVLTNMRSRKISIPVIILSSLTQREAVIKAMGFGIKSFLSKPLKPLDIMKKTEEILRLRV
ncbi:MAG TPA: response regulator [Spirochaetia bacterium]|nr:response regulator [Spirochaetia bacterium]